MITLVGLNLFQFMAAALVFRLGRREDQVAALVAVAASLADFLPHWEIGTWRASGALLNLGLLAAYMALMVKGDRWWLIAAVACQLVIVTTYLFPFMIDDLMLWSTVTVRTILWCLINFAMIAGATEAWADRQFRLRGSQNASLANRENE